MNISEMIARLEALREKHGDLPVFCNRDGDIETVKYIEHQEVDTYCNQSLRYCKAVGIFIE